MRSRRSLSLHRRTDEDLLRNAEAHIELAHPEHVGTITREYLLAMAENE